VKSSVHADATKMSGYDTADHGYEQDAGNFARSPAFVQHLKDVQTKELGRAHFEARVVPQGDPHLRVEWLKDGRSLNSANRIQTFQVGALSAPHTDRVGCRTSALFHSLSIRRIRPIAACTRAYCRIVWDKLSRRQCSIATANIIRCTQIHRQRVMNNARSWANSINAR
jgi:hypothetical protein